MVKRQLIESQQNVVVLDDDLDSISYFKKVLDKIKECNINYFSSAGPDFFRHINQNHIDLFIMDIVLGNQTANGIQVSEEIICKKQGSIFLFISGYDYSEPDFKHLNGQCVYDFISKPFDIQCFVTVVSTLLNVASSYKIINRSRSFCPKEIHVDDMRQKYLKMLDEDKALIKKLRSSCLALQATS